MRLRKVRLENILSFKDAVISELGPLTILIGPNASGKSNFLDALSLLQAAPQKALSYPISLGGGIREWLWRGEKSHLKTAKIECELDVEGSKSALQYLFALSEQPDGGFVIPEERLTRLRPRGAAPTPLFDRRDGRNLRTARPLSAGPDCL